MKGKYEKASKKLRKKLVIFLRNLKIMQIENLDKKAGRSAGQVDGEAKFSSFSTFTFSCSS